VWRETQTKGEPVEKLKARAVKQGLQVLPQRLFHARNQPPSKAFSSDSRNLSAFAFFCPTLM